MAMPSDDHGDLSVSLDWPIDPLVERHTDAEQPEQRRVVQPDPLASRLDVLEETYGHEAQDEDVAATVEDVADRLDHVVADVADILRAINDTLRRSADEQIAALDERITGLRTAVMAMLASKEADDQRAQRREREALVGRLQEEMSGLARTVTDGLAASRKQTDAAAERIAEELQALRRRIPVKGAARGNVALDDDTLEALVTQLADEVEIRVAATLRAKPIKKR